MKELFTEHLITFLFGGGLLSFITAVVTIKYTKKQAEANAMKAMQDVYQELITDLRNDKSELKKDKEDTELKLLQKMEAMEKKQIAMEKQLTENNKRIQELQSLKCTQLTCLNRIK